MSAVISQPAGMSRWWILGLLFACRAALGFEFQTLGSVTGSLVSQFGFSYAQIGTLIGLFMLPGLLLALPAGWLGRRVADRPLVCLALFCMAGGGVVAALAQGFGQLALGRLACGLGFVFGTIFMTKMATDWFAGHELATALGILVMSWPFGIAVGQLGQAWIDLHFGWPAVFAVAALYCAAAGAALWLLYRPPPGLPPQQPGPMRLPRHELLLTLVAAICWGLYNAGYIVYLSFAPRVLQGIGYGAAPAAAVISLASWAMIVSGALGGRIADRSGRGAAMFYMCTVLGIGALLLLRQPGWAVPLSLLFGLAGGAPAGVIMALTGEAMAAERRAVGMGLFFSLYFVLLSVAPPVAGWLHDTRGDAFVPLLFGIVLFVAAAVCFGLFGALKRRLPAVAGGAASAR